MIPVRHGHDWMDDIVLDSNNCRVEACRTSLSFSARLVDVGAQKGNPNCDFI
jgi:hypothetical protein